MKILLGDALEQLKTLPDEFWKYIIKSGVRSQEWEDKIIKTKNIIITGFENAFRETCKFELLEELGRLAA